MKIGLILVSLASVIISAQAKATSPHDTLAGCFNYGPNQCPPGEGPPKIIGDFRYGPQFSDSAMASAYLPSQGNLRASANCQGLSIHPGENVQIQASERGVVIATGYEKITLDANNVPQDVDAAGIGQFGGVEPGAVMAIENPVLINGRLVYNDFGALGGGGGLAALKAGVLVEPNFELAGFDLFDNGHGIVISGTKYPVNNSGIGVKEVKCELE